jgi:hypothetical protein
VLNEDLADRRTLPRRDHIDDGVEDLGVVEDVDGFAVERESGEDFLDDEDGFRFHCWHGGVRNDVEGGVEDRARLLQKRTALVGEGKGEGETGRTPPAGA